jgi:hypothetical protein
MSNFWANPQLRPKRQHRWVVYTDHFEAWIAKKVGRPSYTIGETEHKFLNHSFWYPGRITWDTIDLTIVDPGSPLDSTRILYEVLMNSGYVFPESPNERATISKAGAVNALGQVTIEELTPEGNADNSFTIFNAWIAKAALGELDYSGEDLVELTLTLRYDYAKYG